MIKYFPVAVAVIMSLSGFQFAQNQSALQTQNLTTVESEENKNPRNHLTQDEKNRNEVKAKMISVTEAATTEERRHGQTISEQNIFRLTWDVVPYAVKYKVFYSGKDEIAYTTGIEISAPGDTENFKVTALDFDGNVIKEDVKINSVEKNPKAPLTTTEFHKMSFAPLYPVYSWIPTKDADHYEIQLFKDGVLCRNFVTEFHPKDDNYDFYDEIPVIDEGEYYWRVRGISKDNKPITEWSGKTLNTTFRVKTPMRFCALGDSITHGGGSISVPPSRIMYSWENYSSVPIKNLGRSGDTTAQLLERFDNDVLPFRPEVLIIMAGVNDFRSDIIGWDSTSNLEALKIKCEENGIKPVFVTPTPINPALMAHVDFVEPPPENWQEHRKYICDWIRKQEFYIDIWDDFTDDEGNLKVELTTDGLHPDAEGKQIIGRAVAAWLNNYLDSLK